jgi:hypothetical protein
MGQAVREAHAFDSKSSILHSFLDLVKYPHQEYDVWISRFHENEQTFHTSENLISDHVAGRHGNSSIISRFGTVFPM